MKNKYGFILIKPQLGENIGASARSLKNFGFKKLAIFKNRLEFSYCSWDEYKLAMIKKNSLKISDSFLQENISVIFLNLLLNQILFMHSIIHANINFIKLT